MRFNNVWPYRRILFTKRFLTSLWRSRRNIISSHLGYAPPAGPFMAELDVTYRCNCCCEMCQRWRDDRANELTLDEYQKLAAAFHDQGVRVVSIAGGEPLMRDDIFAIIDAFAKYRMKVNLCTNGILLESCAETLCRSGAFCITVSIDGVTAQTHDKLRGTDGSFDQIKKGIKSFMAQSLPHQPLLRVRMTISNRNTHEIRSFYEQWKNSADDILLQPIHYCRDAFYTGFEEESLRLDPDLLEQQIEGTPLQTNGYLKKLIHSLRQTHTYPNERCYAGVLMVRIDPWGNVYPCLEQHVRIGSVREQDFRTIWNSSAFNHERTRIASEGNCRCWYNNTAMISHYGKTLFHTTMSGLKQLSKSPLNAKTRTDHCCTLASRQPFHE